jgi:hypothetical protein
MLCFHLQLGQGPAAGAKKIATRAVTCWDDFVVALAAEARHNINQV